MKLCSFLVASVLLAASAFAADPPKTPPDLTQDSAVDRKLTYNLGATGLRGWIYSKPATYFDGLQGRTTAASRQILVTHVGAKSPGDGVVKVDDVILGVGGRPFSEDARKSFAGAIQTSEQDTSRHRRPRVRTDTFRDGGTERILPSGDHNRGKLTPKQHSCA